MVGAGYLVLLFLTSAQKESLSEEKWVSEET
jgi:hypothetical protein